MIMKSLFAAAALATVAAAGSAPANAKVDVDLYFGFGGYGDGYYEEPAPRYYEPAPRYHEGRRRHSGYGSSCEAGIDEVRAAGFHRVRALDCSGSRYVYKARKRGGSYVITVKRKSGNIINIEQVW
jgi:hypothetical protein